MEDQDPARLAADNARLLKVLKELTIEKNMMEAKLYRSFGKLLKTKKRRIKQLERALKKAKVEIPEETETSHCDTCKCFRRRSAANRQQSTGGATLANEDAGGDDSDATIDPGSDYGSDTDIDEEGQRPSNSRSSAEKMENGNRVAASTSKNGEGKGETRVKKSTGKEGSSVQGAPAPVTTDVPMDNSQCSPTLLPKPDSQSDVDMDGLFDELCS